MLPIPNCKKLPKFKKVLGRGDSVRIQVDLKVSLLKEMEIFLDCIVILFVGVATKGREDQKAIICFSSFPSNTYS